MVRQLAALLAGLEDAVVAAGVPEGLDARLETWLIEGIEAGDVPAARAEFERYAAAELLPVHERALSWIRQVGTLAKPKARWPRGEPLRIETPRGVVIVGTPTKDVYEEDAWLLVDPGGNDVYRNNAGGTGRVFRSALCVDLEGDDRYESEAPFTQGAARDGVGGARGPRGRRPLPGRFLLPGGRRVRRGPARRTSRDGTCSRRPTSRRARRRSATAVSLAGVGDDSLRDRSPGPGARPHARRRHPPGRRRQGPLRDEADPRVDVLAVDRRPEGPLVLRAGVRIRVLRALRRGTPRRVQGAGHPRPHAGRVGVLIDNGGDDVYEGSMYAQGTAYFYGLGISRITPATTAYTATWYGQGAAPHFACGILRGRRRQRPLPRHAPGAGERSRLLDGGLPRSGRRRRLRGRGPRAGLRRPERRLRDLRGRRGRRPLRREDEARPRLGHDDEARGAADRGETVRRLGRVPRPRRGRTPTRATAVGADGATWIQARTRRGIGIDR